MRKIEKIAVPRDVLEDMKTKIKAVMRDYNPETGKPNGYVFTNDGVNGYIIQSNNIVLHKADGTLKCWHTM